MKLKARAAADDSVNPRWVWPHLYWVIEREPWDTEGGGPVNRRERRRRAWRNRETIEGIDALEFSAAYNRLEVSEPNVRARIDRLLDWLHERAEDEQAGEIARAYAWAVKSARESYARRRDRPPATYLESKERGEALLREDFERRVSEVGREQALEELHRRPD